MKTMKTKIVQIGNSRGVRLPKSFIKEAGLEYEVELRLVEGGILVESAPTPRAGWSEAARRLHDVEKGVMLDEPVATHFDDSEWSWE